MAERKVDVPHRLVRPRQPHRRAARRRGRHRRPRPALRDPRLRRPPRARQRRSRLDLKITERRAQGDALRLPHFSPTATCPRWRLRLGADAQDDPLYAQAPDVAGALADPRVDGRHRAPAPASWPRRWRGGPRAQPRGEHPPALRAADQPHHRRRWEAGLDEVLLHAQAHAREGVEGLRVPAGRLRHAGRDVRAAHPDPDGARARPCPSCSSTSLAAPTGSHWRVHPGRAGQPGTGDARRPQSLPRHRRCRAGQGGDQRLLRQLRLDAVRR